MSGLLGPGARSFLEARSPAFTMRSLETASSGGAGELADGVCSRRDPSGEALRQVEAWLSKLRSSAPRFVVSSGFGGGWHLRPLAASLPPGSFVYVAEPSPEAFSLAFQSFDFGDLEASGASFRFGVSSKPAEICADISKTLDLRGVALPSLFIHPGSSRKRPELHSALNQELSALARRRFLDVRTAGALGSEWLLNALESLPLSLSASGIDVLRGCNAGRPAIVAGAGPSLDEATGWISKASGRVPVFCAGTALKSLLAKGVEPDFVVVVDSDPRVEAQFEGVPASAGFRLLAPCHVSPSLLKRYEDRLILFSTGLLPGMNEVLKACDALPASLRTAGTVATSAIDAARFAGSSEIYLAGLDLAMGEGGRTHSAGSVYDGLSLDRAVLLQIPGNRGGNVFTTPQFAHYVELLDSFLPELETEGIKVWNASFGGALLKGAASPDVERLASLGRLAPLERSSSLAKLLESKGFPSRASSRELPVSLLQELDELSLSASEMAGLYRAAKEAGGFSGALLAIMDGLDKKINSDNLAKGLCGDAMAAFALGLTAGGLANSPEALGQERAAELGVAMHDALSRTSADLARRLRERTGWN